MLYSLELFIIRCVAWFLSLFPIKITSSFACGVASIIFLFMPKRRKIALDNIEKAYGSSLNKKQKIKIARASFQNMALSVLELFITDRMLNELDRFEFEGLEHAEKAFGQGKGAILVISHLGSWEYLSFLPFITGQKWSVVVKNVRNPYLDQLVNEKRRKMALNPISKKSSIRTVLKELKQNHGVGIVIDQWAGPEGLWTQFFGEGTSTTSIPSRLAKQMGSVMIPAYCLRKSAGSYLIQLEESLELDPNQEDWEKSATDKLNKRLEAKILEYPEQWAWVHRRWKPKPDNIRNL